MEKETNVDNAVFMLEACLLEIKDFKKSNVLRSLQTCYNNLNDVRLLIGDLLKEEKKKII